MSQKKEKEKKKKENFHNICTPLLPQKEKKKHILDFSHP
jgi:hypothetical protein